MAIAVIQMGHVPRTSGSVGAPGEQAYARGVADRARPLLEALGLTVRTIDADPPLTSYRGDLFVAIHYDGGPPGAAGPSVGWQTAQGRQLADLWKTAYRRRAGNKVGPTRRDNYTTNLAHYYGVRKAVSQGNKAAVIVEGGFGSHPQEGRWLRSDAGMSACAAAIRDAAAAYLGLTVQAATPGDDMSDPRIDDLHSKVDALLARVGVRDGSPTVLADLGRVRRDIRRLVCDLGLAPDMIRPDGGYES